MVLDFKKYNPSELLTQALELFSLPASIPLQILWNTLRWLPLLVIEMALGVWILWPQYLWIAVMIPALILCHLARVALHTLITLITRFCSGITGVVGASAQMVQTIHQDLNKTLQTAQDLDQGVTQLKWTDFISIQTFIGGFVQEVIQPVLAKAIAQKVPIFKKRTAHLVHQIIDFALRIASPKLAQIDHSLEHKITVHTQAPRAKIQQALAHTQQQRTRAQKWSHKIQGGFQVFSESLSHKVLSTQHALTWPLYTGLGGITLAPLALWAKLYWC